jgi:aspartyl-tRNA synthetase
LGKLVFIDLRDHYGLTQVVFSREMIDQIGQVGPETVLQVCGSVYEREQSNPALPTGAVEVQAEDGVILGSPGSLPFSVTDERPIPEATRLKYRFLDLRRPMVHDKIVLRSAVIRKMREVMHEMGFIEIETPILTSTSPEGARDFVVPSRLHPGKFYALPQAPQQFKQLLMVGGFDRYFQIAPCFRDEDSRADRSPGEFRQLDLEMAFVSQEDVLQTAEKVLHLVFAEFAQGRPVTEPPFPRLLHEDAMRWYGTDKPDLRIVNKITDIAAGFQETEVKMFRSLLDAGHGLWALGFNASEIGSRKYFDGLSEKFIELGGAGLAWLAYEGEKMRGSIAKHTTEAEQEYLRQQLELSEHALVLVAGGDPGVVLPALGKLRLIVAEDLGAIEEDAYRLCWVTDFPMYERDPESGEVTFGHNPFSMPKGGIEALNTQGPLSIKAWQYDIVCNGVELSSGAIRNHEPETMYRAFEIAGYPRSEVDERFGGMIRALKHGAPPHGGIAPGVERIVMLLAQTPNIREITPFPMTPDARDLMMNAPSELSPIQLHELGLSGVPQGVGARAISASAADEDWFKADEQPENLVLISKVGERVGETVSILGWVVGVRTSKKRAFIELRDGSGFIQAIAEYIEFDDESQKTVESLAQESSVCVEGKLVQHPRKPEEVELHLKSIKVLQAAVDYPISRKAHGTEFLLGNRHLWLRSSKQVAIQRIRNSVIFATYDFFKAHGFTKIDSPILTATSCEGTTTLFPVDYFGEPAFLSQSGQLYLEAAIAAHGRVFDFGPVFRSEQSKTRKHLAEFWMMDAEVAFLGHEGNLRLQEQLILHIIERVLAECRTELAVLERDTSKLEAIRGPFTRVPFREVVQILRGMGSSMTEELDFGAPDEALLSEVYQQPVFITEWPAKLKAFYMKEHPKDRSLVLAADLMAPEGYGELIGGSQREDDPEKLLHRMEKEKISEDLGWYLDVRKFGSVTHSGFGFGLERLVSWLAGVAHIRETIPFPRLLNRLRP